MQTLYTMLIIHKATSQPPLNSCLKFCINHYFLNIFLLNGDQNLGFWRRTMISHQFSPKSQTKKLLDFPPIRTCSFGRCQLSCVICVYFSELQFSTHNSKQTKKYTLFINTYTCSGPSRCPKLHIHILQYLEVGSVY